MSQYTCMRNYTSINVENLGFLSGYTLDDNTENNLIDIFISVLVKQDCNVIQFDYLVSKLLRTRVNPIRILDDVIGAYTNDIYNTLLGYINDDYSKINYQFIKIYNDYVKSCLLFKKLFNRVLNYSKYTNNNNNHENNIYMISNYWFFKNVLDKQYNNNYIHHFLNFNDELSQIVNIIKIYGFYLTFIKQLNQKEIIMLTDREVRRDIYYDKTEYERDPESITLDDNIITNDIINLIIDTIDKNIRSFSTKKDNQEEVSKLVSDTVEYIKIFTKLKKHDFISKYINKLKYRLLDGCNYIIENKLIGSFYNYDQSNHKDLDIIRAKLMLDDFSKSDKLNGFIKDNIIIKVTSDKYKDLDINQKINVKLSCLTEELWANTIQKDTHKQHSNNYIAFYADMYKKSIEGLSDKKKTLDINYSQSIVMFDYTVNNKTYKIKSNVKLCNILTDIINNVDIQDNIQDNDKPANILANIINNIYVNQNLNNNSCKELDILLKSKLVIAENLNSVNLVKYTINNNFNSDNLILDLYDYTHNIANNIVVNDDIDDSNSECDELEDLDSDEEIDFSKHEIKIDENGNEYIEVIEEVEVEEGDDCDGDGEEVYYEEVVEEVEVDSDGEDNKVEKIEEFMLSDGESDNDQE